MIIYQFHMLSDGNIKISKAEYKESKDYKGNYCLKKLKVIEKEIRCPKFPTILYKLGKADYNKYYAFSMNELATFKLSKIYEFEGRIKSLENQIKNYNEIIENLEKKF